MRRIIAIRHTVTIGLMLFALFFGAGNLVFPAMLGQYAGQHYGQANLGFLITGVGLPLLGTLALGFSGSESLLSLTRRVHPWFAIGYTTLLYLTIGPLFAMPRTGSVSYEIAAKPFIAPEYDALGLAVCTLLFFGLSLLLSMNPARMVAIVGNILTPALIACIAFLAAAAVMMPLGEPQEPSPGYDTQAFFVGFQEGYLTMDVLAAFVFGIIVIGAIRDRGVRERKELLLVCTQAAVLAAAILAVIYTSLTYIGASSTAAFGLLANGGEVLTQVTRHYFGTSGAIVLGVIVLLACLTTSIGLTTACSSYFHQLIPALSHQQFCLILSAVSALAANLGLTPLIRFSVPVLSLLYPMAIVLIGLTFLHDWFRGKRAVYAISLLMTILFSLVDGLTGSGVASESIQDWFTRYIPLHSIGLGWLLPALAGALAGLLLPQRWKSRRP